MIWKYYMLTGSLSFLDWKHSEFTRIAGNNGYYPGLQVHFSMTFEVLKSRSFTGRTKHPI